MGEGELIMDLRRTTIYQLQINEEEYTLLEPLLHETILYRLNLYEIVKISSFKTEEYGKIYTLFLLPAGRTVELFLDNKAQRMDRFTLWDEDNKGDK